MAKFCLRLQGAATLALLTFTTSCSSISLLDSTVSKTVALRNYSTTRPFVSKQSPSNCSRIDPFAKGINKAMGAATLAQSAQSKQDWDLVVSGWIQAVGAMQSVPPDNPKHVFAQKKAAEYLQNLNVAIQKAANTKPQLPFVSFDNQIFDEQLLLYLSYVAAVGPPDVLIVGSSRALVGVDPRQLQQALAAQGKGNLKIFNFGINGATAQIVDFQLRQVLRSEQLPRLILWADGLRAFNSGRPDRTYNSMVASAGYQRLMSGDRPQLPQSISETIDQCEEIPGTSISSTTPQKSIALKNSSSSAVSSEQWQIAQVSFETRNPLISLPDEQLLLSQLDGSTQPTQLALAQTNAGYSSFAIDANGFLPLNTRFDPRTYYQTKPRVAGRYDADYQPFNLAGPQTTALNSVKAFAKQQQIPLVFVNLPLTQDYLDSVRRLREQQFQQMMQRQAGDGFIFIDLGRQGLNQNQYFSDPSHLNRYGAAAVSSQLATNPQIPWPQPR